MVCRATMGASMLSSPLSLSQELSFRSRNGGQLRRSTGGVQFRGRDNSGCSRWFVPMVRCLGGSSSDSIRMVSCAGSGGFMKTDSSFLIAQGLRGILGGWSTANTVRRRSSSGRGGGRGWERLGENSNMIVMRSGGDKNDNSSGDDQVETLFMRELRRRGMSSKEQDGGSLGSTGTDTKTKEDDSESGGPFGRGWSLPGTSKTKPSPQLTESQRNEQLKRSKALSSEGLDGLIPRATELVKLGGTFFLALWPFVLAVLVAFLAAYLYFGSAFIHTGDSFEDGKRPPNVDPSQLLEEDVIPSQIGPNRVPYH